MSRTRHHHNQHTHHGNEDLWSRRPCSQSPYSAENKKLTRQIERARRKKLIKEDWDND